MIYLNELHRETLWKIDEMIGDNKTFKEIEDWLYDNDFIFSQEIKNGYRSKTKYHIEKIVRDKNGYCKYENTFVDLIKRRNGLAYWETIKLS